MPSNILSNDGKEYLLKLMVERPNWVGLSYINSPSSPITLALLTDNEPSNSLGYSRKQIVLSDWLIESASAKIETVPFVNSGGRRWPPVNAIFLATSAENEGVLLSWNYMQSWIEVNQPRYLFPSEKLNVPIDINFAKEL
jgi:hypothetical protein